MRFAEVTNPPLPDLGVDPDDELSQQTVLRRLMLEHEPGERRELGVGRFAGHRGALIVLGWKA